MLITSKETELLVQAHFHKPLGGLSDKIQNTQEIGISHKQQTTFI